MKGDFPQGWLRDLINSGLVRAIASGGASRGDGKHCRSGSYTALVVYLAILSTEDRSPSLTEIQRVTGIGSKNTVIKCIETLESLGAIRVDRLRVGNRYEVLGLPDLALPAPSSSARTGSGRSRRERRVSYRGPDGHVLRSEVELVVDILLFCHGVPHATEVPYSAIFEEHGGKHTMDFLLTPSMGIEVWGASGPDYAARRSRKESAAKEHGFSLHGVSSVEDAYTLIPRLAAELGETFGGADSGTLRRLLRLFRQGRGHRDTLPGVVALTGRLEVVKAEEAKGTRRSRQTVEDEYWMNPYGARWPELRPSPLRPKSDGFSLTCDELRDARQFVERAARAAQIGAGRLAEDISVQSEQSWAEEMLRLVRYGKSHLDEADGALGGAEAILKRRLETPEQAAMRRDKAAEEVKKDTTVMKALRLLRCVEAALRGESNPYAESDARKAQAAKKAALRAVMVELMPELASAAGSHLDDAVETIQSEIRAEDLADLL